MLEAELKYEVPSLSTVRKELDRRAEGKLAIYHDIYFDNTDRELFRRDAELRIRTVISQDDTTKQIFTVKSPPTELKNKNKFESEFLISNADQAISALKVLGFAPVTSLSKECVNYELTYKNKQVACTLVKLSGFSRYFVEIEAQTSQEHYESVISFLSALAQEIGLDESQRTAEYYTDIVTRNP